MLWVGGSAYVILGDVGSEGFGSPFGHEVEEHCFGSPGQPGGVHHFAFGSLGNGRPIHPLKIVAGNDLLTFAITHVEIPPVAVALCILMYIAEFQSITGDVNAIRSRGPGPGCVYSL